MSKTSISLGEHFEAYVAAQVAAGRYGNRSEVIRDALRDHEEKQAKIKADTLAMMERGIEDIRAGRTKPAEQAIRDIASSLGLDLDR
ncbi:MAG: type II toxin-antitoxin system ParD family antitoxin [Cyanobacteria bacterium J06648_11]